MYTVQQCELSVEGRFTQLYYLNVYDRLEGIFKKIETLQTIDASNIIFNILQFHLLTLNVKN